MKWSYYLLVLWACVSFGCATTAPVQYDRAVDFSKYHTYAWGGLEQIPDGDGHQRLLTLNPHITRVANRELTARGLTANPGNLSNYAQGAFDAPARTAVSKKR